MQNGMIDLYVRGNNSVAYSEIYSSFASEKNSYISEQLHHALLPAYVPSREPQHPCHL